MSLIQIQSLAIGYNERGINKVLQENINLSISSGEIISIMGQNGVGKTTFIKTLTGLQKEYLDQFIISNAPLIKYQNQL